MKKSDYHTRIEEICGGFQRMDAHPAEKKRGRPRKTKGISKPMLVVAAS
jgi:hypothetical protein